MAATHGSKAKFRADDSGGTLRDLSGYVTDAGLDRTADTAEVSVLGDTNKRYVAGLKDASIPLGGVFDPVVDGYLDGMLGLIVDFEYDPQGVGVGLVRYTGTGILSAYGPSTGVGAAGTWSGTFQVTGGVSRAIQT